MNVDRAGKAKLCRKRLATPAPPSSYFTNEFTVVKSVRRVNFDLPQEMLRDLDERAAELNLSRQAVIKTLLVRELDEDRENKRRPKSRG